MRGRRARRHGADARYFDRALRLPYRVPLDPRENRHGDSRGDAPTVAMRRAACARTDRRPRRRARSDRRPIGPAPPSASAGAGTRRTARQSGGRALARRSERGSADRRSRRAPAAPPRRSRPRRGRRPARRRRRGDEPAVRPPWHGVHERGGPPERVAITGTPAGHRLKEDLAEGLVDGWPDQEVGAREPERQVVVPAPAAEEDALAALRSATVWGAPLPTLRGSRPRRGAAPG